MLPAPPSLTCGAGTALNEATGACELSGVGHVSTLAGSGSSGSADGVGTAASFTGPFGVATSCDGATLFVAEPHLVRQVVIATGEVSTLAGSGSSGSADGVGAAASFNGPSDVATSPDGATLFVADYGNHLMRKVIIATGAVSTLAGSGSIGSANGVGAAASFHYPHGVAVSADGATVFVGDQYNKLVRQVIILTGAVSTLAGSGSGGAADGVGAAASFSGPTGVVASADGATLFVVDHGNHLVRRVVIATGAVSTLAGSGSFGAADGVGAAANFGSPTAIAASAEGATLYVADYGNDLVRQVVVATGEVSTLAGIPRVSGFADGGINAVFDDPYGLAVSINGTSLFVADFNNKRIREVRPPPRFRCHRPKAPSSTRPSLHDTSAPPRRHARAASPWAAAATLTLHASTLHWARAHAASAACLPAADAHARPLTRALLNGRAAAVPLVA